MSSEDAMPESAKPDDVKSEDAKDEGAAPVDGAPEDGKPEDAATSSSLLRLELAVPEDAKSVCEALRKAKEKGAEELVVRLAEDFQEPREAWPLELEATTQLRFLEVVGPEDHSASLCDVALSASGPVGSGPTVTLRHLVLRGPAGLSGLGCALESCELRKGAETGPAGAGVIRGCTVRNGGGHTGLSLHGPLPVVEGNEIVGCAIGVCLYDNPLVVLSRNRLLRCGAGAVVLHCSIGAELGASIDLGLELAEENVTEDCALDFEVHVEVDRAEALTFQEWPLPAGIHSTPMRRGGHVDVEVVGTATLRVVASEGPSSPHASRKRKSRRQRPTPSERMPVERRPAALGPGLSWARDVLGVDDADEPLKLQGLRRAYRQKAREVHPDKVIDVDGAEGEEPGAAFLEVREAYEALLEGFGAAARPVAEPRKKRKRDGG